MPQSLSQIYLHIIFSTHNREPFLRTPEIREKTWAYLAGILARKDSKVLRIGGTDDHVHVLCTLPRTQSVAELVKEMKRSSTNWLNGEVSTLRNFHWQRGYGAFSVSQSHIEQVRRYIQRQEEHHGAKTFQEKFRAFLRKYEIEWDERHVWD